MNLQYLDSKSDNGITVALDFHFNGLFMGKKIPDSDHQSSPHALQEHTKNDILLRGKSSLKVSKANLGILHEMCDVAQEFSFDLVIQIAPIPQTTYDQWSISGTLSHFRIKIEEFFQKECTHGRFVDEGGNFIFPDEAMRDSDHLIRHDWTNAYAMILDDLVRSLP